MAISVERLSSLKSDLKRWGANLGFDAIGVTDIDLSAHEPKLRAWLAQGFQGSMSYLERNVEKRLDPALLVPGTVRVICARMNYQPTDDEPLRVLAEPTQGYIARYALGRDYHKVVRRKLARLGERLNEAAAELEPQGRAFTDSAPVLERPLAERAGLGWVGKHTLLLNREVGSWFFLGEIFTNLPLPIDQPTPESHCGACKACITVCPTDAIIAPGLLDARRCISYLTIESSEAIPKALRPKLGNRVFGCDDCQLYCPWNRSAPATQEADFTPRRWDPREHRTPSAASTETPTTDPIDLRSPDLLALFALDEAAFLALAAGSAIRRLSYAQWQRNLAVALGNGPATSAAITALTVRRRALGRALNDSLGTYPGYTPGDAPGAQHGSDEAMRMVLEHIDWALERLTELRPEPMEKDPAGC